MTTKQISLKQFTTCFNENGWFIAPKTMFIRELLNPKFLQLELAFRLQNAVH